MLSDEKYVVLSLELHLFFARIMKEHSLFLEAGFTPRDAGFAKEADDYKRQFEAVLLNAVKVSNGVIRNDVLQSGEIVTDYTLGTEQKTQNFTGIQINQEITRMESRLYSSEYARITPDLVQYVRQLNHHAKILVDGLIGFKQRVLDAVLSCNMFTVNYPLLIEHIMHEAKKYRSLMTDIDNDIDIDNNDPRQTELFWDQIMMEHALFIRGLLDPTETALIDTSDQFAKDYARLLESARAATDLTISSITNETLEETMGLKDFKQSGTTGIAECKIRSIILPLLADHVLRESSHFIRLLRNIIA